MLFTQNKKYPTVEEIIFRDNYHSDQEKCSLRERIKNISLAIETIPIGLLYSGEHIYLDKFKEIVGLQDEEIEALKVKLEKENNIKSTIEKQIDEIVRENLWKHKDDNFKGYSAWSIALEIRALRKWRNLRGKTNDQLPNNILEEDINGHIGKGIAKIWELRNVEAKGWASAQDEKRRDEEGLNVYDTSVVTDILLYLLKKNNSLFNEQIKKELPLFFEDSIYRISERIINNKGGCFASNADKKLSVEALCYALLLLITTCKIDESESFYSQEICSKVLSSVEAGLDYLLSNNEYSTVNDIASRLHLYMRLNSVLPLFSERYKLNSEVSKLQDELLNRVKFRNNFFGWIDDKEETCLNIRNTSSAITSLIRSGIDSHIPVIYQGLMFLTDPITINGVVNKLDFTYVLCAIVDYIITLSPERSLT